PLAKAKDIYVLPFEDAQEVSAERVGYVALCRGLGIIGGSGGSFRPQDETTMAEMAAAVYKAMSHIRSIR
ncbi:MAG: S-layer homology domain-containing protein, partial [Thermotaleaceae bacterium]